MINKKNKIEFLRKINKDAKITNPIYLTNIYSKEYKLIDIIGSNKNVLEIGCYNGHMSLYLNAMNCTITGFEIDEKLANQAKKFCKDVIIGNIEDQNDRKKINEFS